MNYLMFYVLPNLETWQEPKRTQNRTETIIFFVTGTLILFFSNTGTRPEHLFYFMCVPEPERNPFFFGPSPCSNLLFMFGGTGHYTVTTVAVPPPFHARHLANILFLSTSTLPTSICFK
jgi:hypothetical protein